MDRAKGEQALQVPSSVLRHRLAWTEEGEPPTIEDLGLTGLMEAAVDWQRQRSHSEWNEFLLLGLSRRSEWVTEIHGLFGVAGELVLTLIEAEAEIAVLWSALDGDRPASLRAALWRSLRFFAESEANTIIVFGHTVANLTVRTLALYPNFDPTKIPKLTNRFEPRSTRQEAWLSLHPGLPDVLRQAAGQCPAGCALVDALSSLTNGRWDALRLLRNSQYHRWRGESPGVTGIDLAGDSMRAKAARGESIEMGGHPAEHNEGHDVLTELTSGVSDCLRELPPWMDHYLRCWHAAFAEAKLERS